MKPNDYDNGDSEAFIAEIGMMCDQWFSDQKRNKKKKPNSARW